MASPDAWLGLARRAGRIAVGRVACRQALRDRRAAALVVAQDASDAAKRHWARVAPRYGVPVVLWGDMRRLARALGAPGQPGVVAILDRAMAQNFLASVNECVEDARGRRPSECRSDVP